MKNTFLVLVSVFALGLSACSKSSDSGAPEKPNLAPAIETTQAFAVIQQAGPSQTNPVRGMFAALTSADFSQNAAIAKPGKDVRTSELKRLIANPQQCKMGFNDAGKDAPPGTIAINLTINGTNCPILASFQNSVSVDGLEGSASMKYIFQAKTADAQNIIGAKEANVSGSMKYGMLNPDAMKDTTGNTPLNIGGGGQFAGYIETQSYGRVNIAMNFKVDVKVMMGNPEKQIPATVAGGIVESASFQFKDAAMNVTLVKTTTMNNENQTVSYTANGAAISAQEYQEVLGVLSGPSDSSERPDQPNAPTNPTIGQN